MDDDEIKDAITLAIENAMPSKEEILEAITDGVKWAIPTSDIKRAIDNAFPWPSQVLDAIYEATHKAMLRRDQEE